MVRHCYRVDAGLRPEGKAGPLVRSLASFEAYWDRWAEPWEFQALLKARAVGGDAELGAEFDEAASRRLWSRVFTADDLRAVRQLKARSESELASRGLTDREVKRGRGGIRDIEFAVQLLQLVHGRLDPDLHSPNTLTALAELGAAGYVDEEDARQLADAYRFLRSLEHRLQLRDSTQVYAMPVADDERRRIARSLGLRDTAGAGALEQLDAALARHQATVRTIHERLYFRPLLEAFATGDEELLSRPGAVEARLSAFGFSDGMRTRAAVRELTRGLTRSSRLMQQILPLLLGWLAESPDPDLGLLNVRNLVNDPRRSAEFTRVFRESPEAARRLCHLVGTTRLAADTLQRNPALVARLPDPARLATSERADLVGSATLALGWRDDLAERQRALRRWKDRHLLGVIARDVLHGSPVTDVGAGVTTIAEASLEAALEAFGSSLRLGSDRARTIRWCGALVRQRPGRGVRLRGVHSDRLRGGDPAGDGPAPVRRRCDAVRADLEHRPRPQARGQAGSGGPVGGGLRGRTSIGGPTCGNARPCFAPVRWPATRRLGSGSWPCWRTSSGSRGCPSTTSARSAA